MSGILAVSEPIPQTTTTTRKQNKKKPIMLKVGLI